ncbi:MAG: 50S ribosome-binding GTPase, partial [Aquificaceae bacterium]|nr:50S ribosome-binding GTPase [Aquificaceae bacterium]
MRVRFVGSFFRDFPKGKERHAVFIGRSNVGKSSLINMIVG